MEYSNRLGLSFMNHYHIHKEIIANSNFSLLDKIVWNNLIISRSSTSPKENLSSGDLYILPKKVEAQEWLNHESKIAIYLEQQWHFINPTNGMLFIIADEKVFSFFYEDKWVDINNMPF